MRDLLKEDFCVITDLVREHAREGPARRALVDARETLDYAALDALMDRIAAALQRDGVGSGDVVAICGLSSVRYAAVFLGALRAGAAVAPLAPGSTPASLARMLEDAQARLLFLDASVLDGFDEPASRALKRVSLDGAQAGERSGIPLDDWLAPPGARPAPVDIAPDAPFNIIYSSGTTGEPKGIVQPHGMRWAHVKRQASYAFGRDMVMLLSTPLYSNTTLVAFFPALAYGGTVVLMPKFDAGAYLALAQKERATHSMLVPVQYQRIMARPDFGSYDLSAFKFKSSTSAPFPAALKADVLARWPGGLVEVYGMTEGGGTCMLEAHKHPDKLHTVGKPVAGHDIRLIDEHGKEVGPGEAGEIVGHSPGMMKGYHRQPEKTREAEWFDAQGKRFIRTGDVGEFDADGFLVLMDRKKDMVISGGFNIYPSDLEAILREHPDVEDVAVVGAQSLLWGETPVAFVVPRPQARASEEDIKAWFNGMVGKTQRLSALRFIAELPRSAIGKVLKRELREIAGPQP